MLKKEIRVLNHLDIIVEVHGGITGDRFKIVGFDVEAKSIDWGNNPCNPDIDTTNPPRMIYKGANETEGR